MEIREIIKKFIFGYRYSSSAYINHLRKKGIKIGEDCKIYVPTKTLIDEQYPWLITIGNHVRITEGVKILTHDFSWAVYKIMSGGILGSSGRVKIGNNVFIGMNSIITCNVKIEDNVIIGAGSVVTKDCEANSVYAGVPAKKIMEIEDFFEKRKNNQIIEAVILAQEYYKRYGIVPKPDIFHEYFMLFETSDNAKDNKVFNKKIKLCGNEDKTIEYMKNHTTAFENYEEFIKYCNIKE